jgi:hypothetical protein
MTSRRPGVVFLFPLYPRLSSTFFARRFSRPTVAVDLSDSDERFSPRRSGVEPALKTVEHFRHLTLAFSFSGVMAAFALQVGQTITQRSLSIGCVSRGYRRDIVNLFVAGPFGRQILNGSRKETPLPAVWFSDQPQISPLNPIDAFHEVLNLQHLRPQVSVYKEMTANPFRKKVDLNDS